MLSCGILKKTKNDVRCVAPVVRTPLSKQHLLSSFSGMRPISATACEWTHGDVGTHRTPMRVWTLRAHDKRRRKSRNHISPLWKWKQIKATHLYTTKDRKSEEKRCLRRENLGILIFDFFFFPEHHTATGLTQWTIFFLFLYLFKLYLCECF